MKALVSQLVFSWIHSYLTFVDIAILAQESRIKLIWLENYFWALQRLTRLYFLLLKMRLQHAVHWQQNNRLTGTRNCHVPSDVHWIFTSRQALRKLLGAALLEQLLQVPGKSVNEAICVYAEYQLWELQGNGAAPKCLKGQGVQFPSSKPGCAGLGKR